MRSYEEYMTWENTVYGMNEENMGKKTWWTCEKNNTSMNSMEISMKLWKKNCKVETSWDAHGRIQNDFIRLRVICSFFSKIAMHSEILRHQPVDFWTELTRPVGTTLVPSAAYSCKKIPLIFDAISSMAIYQNEIRQLYKVSYTASYLKHLRTLHSSAARSIFFWQRSGAEGAGLAASPASVWKCVCVCEHWGYTSDACDRDKYMLCHLPNRFCKIIDVCRVWLQI